jgi:hypothetical protein
MEEKAQPNPLMRLVRLVGGGVLLVAGLVGLVLPILPGWLFIIPGLSLWSTEFVWAARLRHRAGEEWRRMRPSPTAKRDAA